MDPATTALVAAHAGAACFMAGLCWFVQIVHYPLMAEVGPAEWLRYEMAHTARTSRVVGPTMLLEAGLAVWLVAWAPEGVSARLAVGGLALLAVVWASTFGVQVRLHRTLTARHDSHAIRALVRTNWVRTAAWSGRGVIALAMLAEAGVRGAG